MSTLNPVQKLHRGVEDRLTSAKFLRRSLNKVFPDHWSFLLGEIALYSFIVLLLSGTYLTLFFDPSQNETIYHGSFAPLEGVPMSQAYASTIRL
jgi:ubiquinol-cytochrome c reductase cytochrome b subunit